jgi:transposase
MPGKIVKIAKMRLIHTQKIIRYYYSGDCPECGKEITDQDLSNKIDYEIYCPECNNFIRITSEY